MAQIVLTDEINRATPKTQSVLLEAMEERQVTVDGVTYPTPDPFMVLATQNTIEYEGTFPLPDAQLDRFLLRIRFGYPDTSNEIDMMERKRFGHPIHDLECEVEVDDLLAAHSAIRKVTITDEIKRYIVDLVEGTRNHDEVYLGTSPRGSLALFRTSQALAASLGRDYVIPEDVKRMAIPTLAHRLVLASTARIQEIDAKDIIQELKRRIPVPGGEGL